MRGSYYNLLKLLIKIEKPRELFYGIFIGIFLSGCSGSPLKKDGHDDSAASNVELLSQNAWEKVDHTASADFHFALAQSYSAEGKVDQAIEEYRAALVYDSKSQIIHTKLASEYLRKGSVSFAVEECEKAIQLDSKAIDARLVLGGIYSVSGERDKAIAVYDQVLMIDPNNDEAAVFKTQMLVEKGRNEEALKFISGFVKKVQDSPSAWFYAGKLEQMKGNLSAAISSFRKALDLRPSFTQATLSLGLILEGTQQTGKAEELYQNHLEQKQDLQVAGRLTAIYLKSEKIDSALKVLSIMADLDPDDLNTQMKIGLVQMQKKDWKNAEKAFQNVLSKVPDSDKANYYVSAVYEEMNQMETAIQHLQKISADSRLFEDANLHVALYYKKLGMSEKAFATIQEAMEKAPETAGFYILKASLFEDQKDLKAATEALGDGLKLFPDHEKLRYFYGSLLDKQAKQDEAIAEMEKILKLNPNHADALNYIAYTWTTQGIRLKDAEEMLKKALKLKPNNPFILDSLGWNQFRLGKKESALRYLEKAASLKSDEQAILEHLVEVYALNQMPERARATREKIKRMIAGSEEDVNRKPASAEP